MELLVKMSKEKIQQTLLENAVYCAGLLGVEKAKELFPQYAEVIEKMQNNNAGKKAEATTDQL